MTVPKKAATKWHVLQTCSKQDEKRRGGKTLLRTIDVQKKKKNLFSTEKQQ